MTKSIKLIVLIVASIMILRGTTGCMENNNNSNISNGSNSSITIESVKAEVLEHLTKKYGKEFECVAYSSPSMLNSEYTLALVEKGKDYEGFGFKAYYSLNSDEKITDGYYGVLVRDEITDYILKSPFCKSFKAFSEVNGNIFDEQLNSSSSLSDAIKTEGKLMVYYYVFISSESAYDIAELKDSLPIDMLNGKVSYFVVSNENLGNINYNNLNTTLGKILDGTISSEEKGEFYF